MNKFKIYNIGFQNFSNMYNKFLLITFFISMLLAVSTANAQEQKKLVKPKLVVQIIVEKMRYEILNRYWDRFSENGFKKLINKGTFCKNAYYDYMITESAPGYATISTGANPSEHGIIANKWYKRILDMHCDCVEDQSLKSTSFEFDRNRYSPKLMTGSTFGDELRLSNYKNSKVISVSMNHRAAVLTGGMLANAAYWFDNTTAKWISSSFYMDALPDWVNNFNDRGLPKFYMTKEWTTLKPISSYTGSLADNNSYETGFGDKQHVFPYNLQKVGNSRGLEIIKCTPYGNTYTTDFAIAAMIEEALGKDEYPDLLAINYSSTSCVANLFDIRSVELEDIYLRLDKDLAHLINTIEDRIGLENTIIVLTSDRGAADNPIFSREIGQPTGEFDSERAISLLESYLKAVYGRKRWIKHYENRQIYLNQMLIETSKLSVAEVQQKAAQFIAQFEGVAHTATATALQTTGFTDTFMQKFQNSYNISRSGDVFISLKPGWLETRKHKAGNYITQSSPYRYDAHVPLIFCGWKIKHQEILKAVKMNDIAPTLSNLLRIAFPNNASGTPIEGLD